MIKQRKGILSIEFAVYLVIIVLCLIVIASPGTTRNTLADNVLRDQTLLIDQVLSVWYQSHSGTYPTSLDVLQTMAMIPPSIAVTTFSYSINADSTQYSLMVTLANGTVYKSPASKL